MSQARYEEVRDRYKMCVEEHKNPLLIASMVAEQVGMCDENGDRFFRDDGAPCLNPDKSKRRRKPSDFKLDVLAESIIGRDWKRVLGLENSSKLFPTQEYFGQAARAGLVQEESAAPMGPSMWANVAAWSATVGGLLGAQFNYGYEDAPFELKDLFPVRQGVFYQGGERYVDIFGPYQPAQATGPGEEYPDNTMSALWVEPGPATKYAGKITITKETAIIDISGGQIMAKAANGGSTLAFRENELTIDVLTGQTNNWKLGMLPDTSATAYNTYGATISGPVATRTITNSNVNPFNDVGAMQKSDEYTTNLYNPVTDFPMDSELPIAVFPTCMAPFAEALNAAADFTMMNQSTINQAQPAPGQFPTDLVRMMNPWRGRVRGISSRWLQRRLTASTTQGDPNLTAGLGLSGAAQYRWYRLDPAKAGCRRQMWAPTSQSISPNDWVMATQGLIGGFVWDMSTSVQVLSGYSMQQNKAV